MEHARNLREERARQRAFCGTSSLCGSHGVFSPADDCVDLDLLRKAWSTGAFRFKEGSTPWCLQRNAQRLRDMAAAPTEAWDSDSEDVRWPSSNIDSRAGCGRNFEGGQGKFQPRVGRRLERRSPQTLAIGSWLHGSLDAFGRPLPQALDPSCHALNNDDALLKALGPTRDPCGEKQSRSHQALAVRTSCMDDLHAAFDSWEAKWQRLLAAEDEVASELVRAEATREAAWLRRREAREAQARTAAELRQAADREAAEMQAHWKRTQADGLREFEEMRARWRAEEEAQRAAAPPPSSVPPPRRAAPSQPAKSAAPAKASSPPERSFASWDEYEATWDRFDARLQASSKPLQYADIPWPRFVGGLATATAIGPAVIATPSRIGCSPGDAKKRIFAALRRWHPDKWQIVLERILPADLEAVKCRIKQITEEVLSEKQRLAC